MKTEKRDTEVIYGTAVNTLLRETERPQLVQLISERRKKWLDYSI